VDIDLDQMAKERSNIKKLDFSQTLSNEQRNYILGLPKLIESIYDSSEDDVLSKNASSDDDSNFDGSVGDQSHISVHSVVSV